MFELRWLVRQGWDGPEKILQYRENKRQVNYSAIDENGDFLKVPTWSEWKDVPTVKDE
jgi:hypothetical protein